MHTAGHDEVDGAVVVEVGAHGRHSSCRACQATLRGDFRKRAVAVVAPHLRARRGCRRCRTGRTRSAPGLAARCAQDRGVTAGNNQVCVVIVVVVHPCQAQRLRARDGGRFRQTALRRHVDEASGTFIVEERETGHGADRDIGLFVVVVIRRRTPERLGCDRQAALSRALKRAARRAAKQHRGIVRLARFRPRVQREVVGHAVAISIEQASARADAVPARCRTTCGGECIRCLRDEFDRHGRRRRAVLRHERLGQREGTLITVAQAHRARDLLGRQALEALEVCLRLLGASGALKRSCDAELRRYQEGIELQRARKRSDRVVVLLDLCRHQADEVVAVRVARPHGRGLLERGQRRLGLARALLEQSEVVPGPRVLRVGRRDLHQQGAGRLVALQVDERDRLVHARHDKLRVRGRGFLEPLQALLELLLVHAGDAAVVQADGLRGCRRFGGARGALRCTKGEDGGQDQDGSEQDAAHGNSLAGRRRTGRTSFAAKT